MSLCGCAVPWLGIQLYVGSREPLMNPCVLVLIHHLSLLDVGGHFLKFSSYFKGKEKHVLDYSPNVYSSQGWAMPKAKSAQKSI